jgi:HAD superfamily hydrolase (TIGR01484 family)
MRKWLTLMSLIMINLLILSTPLKSSVQPNKETRKLELFSTDLDGTMFNERTEQTDLQKQSVVKLKQYLSENKIPAVFISGRNIQEVEDVTKKYKLPIPDYVAADVGTQIYTRENNKWQSYQPWQDELEKCWPVNDTKKIHTLLASIKGMELQESFRQSRFKISYYYTTDKSAIDVHKWLKPQIDALGIKVKVLVSGKSKLFIDFLPINGAKDAALEFLANKIGANIKNTFFSGDSGNDEPALLSPADAAFVGDPDTVYAEWLKKNHPKVFIAPSKQIVGVLEGLHHYGYMGK